jgi:hypothetical protein
MPPECSTGLGRILSLVRVLRLTLAAVAALLSSACLVVSLQPVYEPETIAFDPALVGTWLAGEDDMTISFARGEWHSYHVTVEERDDRTRLSARLTRVGERLYLDVSPLDGADVAPMLLPVHGIYRLALDGETLSLSDLNYEQLERLSREGSAGLPIAIDARKNVVITASTAELRRWLVTHADDEGLFDAPTILRRKVLAEEATPR